MTPARPAAGARRRGCRWRRTGRTPGNSLADGAYFNRNTVTMLNPAEVTPYCPPHTPKGGRTPAEAMQSDTPAVSSLRERMASEAG